MHCRLIFLCSLVLIVAAGFVGIGKMKASSLHPGSARAAGGGALQGAGQDDSIHQLGFIGFAGDVLTYHYDPTPPRPKYPGNGTDAVQRELQQLREDQLLLRGWQSGRSAAVCLPLAGQFHDPNTLFVVTEHGSAYAFDADSGSQSWQVSTLGSGETTSDDHGCSQISPEIGITDTPVIDRQRGPNGAMYLVAMSKDSGGNYHQRLHALDLKTGAELFGGPVEIKASYPGTGDGSQNGMVIFAPGQFAERAGLLEMGGVIYIAFTSHCDFRPYTGWVMGYNASTLAQTSVIDVTPNGNEGAIWMAGTGLAGDSSGNIYFLDGNGTFDTTLNGQGFPINGDYGNAFIKLSTSGGLAVS